MEVTVAAMLLAFSVNNVKCLHLVSKYCAEFAIKYPFLITSHIQAEVTRLNTQRRT